MALQSAALSPRSAGASTSLPCAAKYPIICSSSSAPSPSSSRSWFLSQRKSAAVGIGLSKKKRGTWKCTVRSNLDTVGPTVNVGQVTEVDKDTFWPIVKAAGDKTVVLDMYTQWCGPCKVIAPKFQELSKEYLDVVFLKLDCNQENKPLAKELGIRVVPTFKILKDNKVVKEVTGAKFDDLVVAIDAVRSS
ncbi:thioredoxin F-type [Pyrus ussuriensis x Pyrus communis]|uniref:Thioredoxin F-type n=1 Tax=Pyrus ussuriensis x Pyrus communis TaxID=2448454 RepID=A0A5N5HQ48_9ROSA|nr:thioredoxin F-type [Pyrus ussuriensis x Pyrus communis]